MMGGKVGRRPWNLALWVITLHKECLCLHKGLLSTLEVQGHAGPDLVAFCPLCFSRAAAPPGWKKNPAGTRLCLKFTAHNTRATQLCALQRYRWSPLVPSISFSPTPPQAGSPLGHIPLWTRGHSLREGISAPFEIPSHLSRGKVCTTNLDIFLYSHLALVSELG